MIFDFFLSDEADEAEYLWDIVDEYALNDDEYYEDRIEREEKEQGRM